MTKELLAGAPNARVRSSGGQAVGTACPFTMDNADHGGCSTSPAITAWGR
jgi:hypothetical protein